MYLDFGVWRGGVPSTLGHDRLIQLNGVFIYHSNSEMASEAVFGPEDKLPGLPSLFYKLKK